MKLLETRVYRGPNLYGYRPVIRLTLDLEELEQYPSNKIPGFVDRLLADVPTLHEHGCSYGEPGGFIRRLQDGTWFGHITEHIALELQCLAGTPVTYGKTRTAHREGVYHVVYSFEEESVGRRAGELALRYLQGLLPAHFPDHLPPLADLNAEIENLARLAERMALGPSTRSLVDEAKRRGIPTMRLNKHSLVQFGWGTHQKRIQATVTSETRHIAVEIAQDKELTNSLLERAGLPAPQQERVYSADEAVEAAERIGYPVVVKPMDLSHGRGVALNLTTPEAVRDAYTKAYDLSSYVLVETFQPGKDHRVLVVNGEVVAVSERVPGHVVGDGKSTIKELVDVVNTDPRRGVGHEKVLTRIEIDDQASRLMGQAGVTLETVLPAGQVFALRSTGNLSTGGTAIDRTDVIHPDNIDISVRAAKVVGLDVAGIDLICPDISKSVREHGGVIVEINAAPGFRMHVSPTVGTPRNVASPVLEMLFPNGAPARIPLAAITGTNGKTTTSRMVAHILKMSGKRTGLTTTDGIYIDGERILKGDMTGPWSARVVLTDPTVEAAVLETARGGVLREGLGWDRCDVGAVLNVSADHLGLAGIDTVEDLAFVKRLVVEVVRDGGTSVLNADDELVREMADKAGGRVMWFSRSPSNETVRKHVRAGGRAVVLEQGVNGDMITIYDGDRHVPVTWTHLVPATFEGKAKFNVENALAAAAIAFSMGISLEHIRQGLRTFTTSFFQAPGRCNVFDEHPFRVIVDYGHNAAAMSKMAELVLGLRRERSIGVLMAAGDRRDDDIRAIGREAARAFDVVIAKEDASRRGRKPGEIASLLAEGAREAGKAEEQILKKLDEKEAVDTALAMARPGDLVVLFADDVTACWKQVIYWGKERTSHLPSLPDEA
ncbi:cyanophycin synthetase [Polyangium mundeleinium]|uniref:Cyanophycin synthetase n=1 Tax=Polyangium mundeleinium TaxID=2995306 RepID=A0ABT5EW61_9BACT|nr:cyanophycin synthetase [Polyangium mundeleinium]MDC0745552.1 cyanophycin synthetase [Polyangium mundeleinium]